MSQMTIQCRLVASETARRQLWELMAERNTPLINEILVRIGHHSDFPTWRQRGKLPAAEVKRICDMLKTEPHFNGQPARFYISANKTVEYTFKSWLNIQQRVQFKLAGKRRWLEMLQSDTELVERSGLSMENLRAKAVEVLTQHQASLEAIREGKRSSVGRLLFESYRETDDVQTQGAIAYLLKNGCKVSDIEEDPEQFTRRRRKLEIQIERLTNQLENRLPKGRDLTGQRFLNALDTAANSIPCSNVEASTLQSELLKRAQNLPFPVLTETNRDLRWFQNSKGRICLHFGGLSDLEFEVYCDQRYLPYFRRFLADFQTLLASKKHSSSLLLLRSARLVWNAGEGKGAPWNINRLTLFCTIDTRLLSEEGTELVRTERVEAFTKKLTSAKTKDSLTATQENYVKRLNSTLTRIENSFERPSKPLYEGQSHILMGVSLGLENLATVAVMDARANKILAYRSTRQLLGDNYRLLNRQRQTQQQNMHARHKAEKSGRSNGLSESDLGQYIDRLIAKAVVELAKQYRAGSIVVPKLGDMREILDSELRARAEQKIPNCKEGQDKYVRQYRRSIHKWSYGRLIDALSNSAAKLEISVEEGKQYMRGSPKEKARDLAISAYQFRVNAAN
jgi:hypothetical protein